jgi:hypothetical protein
MRLKRTIKKNVSFRLKKSGEMKGDYPCTCFLCPPCSNYTNPEYYCKEHEGHIRDCGCDPAEECPEGLVDTWQEKDHK